MSHDAGKNSTVKFRRRLTTIFPTLPAILLLGVCFLIPIISLLTDSFYSYVSNAVGGVDPSRRFTLINYIEFLNSRAYTNIFWNTLTISLISAIAGLVISYPVAYYLSRPGKSKIKRLVFLLIVVSFFMNAIVRLYAWLLMLGDSGVVNLMLSFVGIAEVRFLNTPFAIEIAIVHWTLPIIVMTLVGSLRNIPTSLYEASTSLGASSSHTFLHVTLPLSLPGIIASILLAFTLNMGAFIVPVVLGGGIVQMLASQIFLEFVEVANYPFGATMATVLLVVTLSASYGINKLLGTKVTIK